MSQSQIEIRASSPDFERELPSLPKGLVLTKVEKKILFKPPTQIKDQKLKERINFIRSVLMFRRKDNKRFLGKFCSFLSLNYKRDRKQIQFAIRLYVALYEKLAINHGSLRAIQILKDYHGTILRYCASQAITPISFCKISKDGLPLVIRPFRFLYKGSLEDRKSVIEIFSLFKILTSENPNPDYTSITKDPYYGKYVSSEVDITPGSFFRELKENHKISYISDDYYDNLRDSWVQTLEKSYPERTRLNRIKRLISKSDIHISSKHGPNGPCLSSFTLDWVSLVSEKVGLGPKSDNQKADDPTLLDSILEFSHLTKNSKLIGVMTTLLKASPDIKLEPKVQSVSVGDLRTSRLRLKQEPGGKVRIFAIADWFSQSVLTGLHKDIFDDLSTFKEDGTFDQNNVANIVKEWTTLPQNITNTVESADLTSATDRLPARLQAEILCQKYGERAARLWLRISRDRVFGSPDGIDRSYAVGQPMGLLSSWAMLALWHHMMMRTIVSIAKQERSLPPGVLYTIIGDDVAMRGYKLYSHYYKIVNDILGVGISKKKGFSLSTRTSNNLLPPINPGDPPKMLHSAEIAKRVFVNGYEITTVPPDEFKSGFEHPSDFSSLIHSLNRRDYHLSSDDIFLMSGFNYKQNQALLGAAFPLSPVPQFKEMIEQFELFNIFYDYYGIEWFNHAYPWSVDDVKRAFNIYLRSRLTESFKLTSEILKSYYNVPEHIESGKWKIYSPANPYFFKLLSRILRSKFNKTVFSTTAIVPFMEETYSDFDMKYFLGKLHVLFELPLAFKGKLDQKDDKKKTSRLILDFSKDITKSLELFFQQSFESDQVI